MCLQLTSSACHPPFDSCTLPPALPAAPRRPATASSRGAARSTASASWQGGPAASCAAAAAAATVPRSRPPPGGCSPPAPRGRMLRPCRRAWLPLPCPCQHHQRQLLCWRRPLGAQGLRRALCCRAPARLPRLQRRMPPAALPPCRRRTAWRWRELQRVPLGWRLAGPPGSLPLLQRPHPYCSLLAAAAGLWCPRPAHGWQAPSPPRQCFQQHPGACCTLHAPPPQPGSPRWLWQQMKRGGWRMRCSEWWSAIGASRHRRTKFVMRLFWPYVNLSQNDQSH